jgi:hypothetical protein
VQPGDAACALVKDRSFDFLSRDLGNDRGLGEDLDGLTMDSSDATSAVVREGSLDLLTHEPGFHRVHGQNFDRLSM